MKWQLALFVSVFLWSYTHSCTTPLGKQSECLSLYDCPTLLQAFEQRPLRNSVVGFLRQSQCGFEGYVPRVCCGPLPSEESSQTTSTTPRPRPTRPPRYDGEADPVASEDSSPAPRNACGIETNGDRIYGGQFTDLDEFPWMSLLGYKTRDNTVTYQCGGALLNHRYVLTAAHCIKGAIEREVGTLVTVRLGEYDLQSDPDCLSESCAPSPQESPVQHKYPHEGFSDQNRNRKDDIGLVRLAKRAKYTYYVQPICLPNPQLRLAPGNDVYVAGWGKTLSGRNSPIKLKLRLPISDKQTCVQKYNTLGAALTENQMCAGGVFAEDACRGDSGGPLMRLVSGTWETVAIVSFGHGCGRDGWPAVYTYVANYLDWIQNTMRESNV